MDSLLKLIHEATAAQRSIAGPLSAFEKAMASQKSIASSFALAQGSIAFPLSAFEKAMASQKSIASSLHPNSLPSWHNVRAEPSSIMESSLVRIDRKEVSRSRRVSKWKNEIYDMTYLVEATLGPLENEDSLLEFVDLILTEKFGLTHQKIKNVRLIKFLLEEATGLRT